MKQLTIQSGDGIRFILNIPDLADLFPEEFREALPDMSEEDRRHLAAAAAGLMTAPEEHAADPGPEEIADAARRGLTAMERLLNR